MAYHASLGSAPSAYPHVSYTSHPHSKDVNSFTGAYSEACDHSEANLKAKITGLETEVKDFKIGMTGLETEVKDFKIGMAGLETEVKDVKIGMGGLETEVKDFKTEMRDFRTEIFHKFDILGTKFESSQKEMAHKFESSQKEMAHAHKEQLSSFANDQQKQFSHFYARGFFGVSLTLHIIYQFLTRSRSWVSRRC
jgi:hypothetical protein